MPDRMLEKYKIKDYNIRDKELESEAADLLATSLIKKTRGLACSGPGWLTFISKMSLCDPHHGLPWWGSV